MGLAAQEVNNLACFFIRVRLSHTVSIQIEVQRQSQVTTLPNVKAEIYPSILN